MTFTEYLYVALVDTLVLLNRYTLKRSLVHHDCQTSSIQCDMLERQCGAPWSLLIEERRRRPLRYTGSIEVP